MYSLSDLTREIEVVIEAFEGRSERRLHPDWITTAVIDRHPDIDGQDSDFYTICTRAQVRDAVRMRLNRYKAKAELEPDQQIVMEGFERLQKRYLIQEDGEQVAVLVQAMTSEQRRAKAQELRAMGYGCFQHADELERFDNEIVRAA